MMPGQKTSNQEWKLLKMENMIQDIKNTQETC